MNRSYNTEDQKMVRLKRQPWTHKECQTIHNILCKKGYVANCVIRIGADGKWHDALQVERADMPQLIEELFRQRLIVEIQAEGSYKASINFCYNYRASTIIDAVSSFRKKVIK